VISFDVPTQRLGLSDRRLVRVVEPGLIELFVGPSCEQPEITRGHHRRPSDRRCRRPPGLMTAMLVAAGLGKGPERIADGEPPGDVDSPGRGVSASVTVGGRLSEQSERGELLGQPSVDGASRSTSKEQNDQSVVADLVDDAVAADADALPPGRTGQRHRTGRSRLGARAVTAAKSAASSASSSSRSTAIGTNATTARPCRVRTTRSPPYTARLTSSPSCPRASVTPTPVTSTDHSFCTDKRPWQVDRGRGRRAQRSQRPVVAA